MSTIDRFLGLVVAALALSLAGGCAVLGPVSSSEVAATTGPTTSRSDPWERFNRAVFGFNEVVDVAVVKPAAQVYRDVVPRIVRTGINNVFGNLGDLWSAANLVLQLKPQPALEMGMRVATNTVFGLGGLLDVAEEMGLERRSYEDFGQTLGRWGLSTGPYLVLPILGPSTVRDGTARIVDNRYSPGRIALREQRDRNTALGLQALSARVGLLNASRVLDDIALDKYVFVRDAYLARRRSQIYDGEPPEDDEPAAPASPTK
ncbi:VacJ family lipoprotein [Ideonella sp. A 288]|uniref:MlaA family lipoprotein n=1 Tax=Ideonella sp. A 288 TaxID=1962181 RepID=UPI001F1C29CD|nr:VacJ family lipoprotein [Ideonella sp. A 288]